MHSDNNKKITGLPMMFEHFFLTRSSILKVTSVLLTLLACATVPVHKYKQKGIPLFSLMVDSSFLILFNI